MLDILFRQITTFIKVCVVFVFWAPDPFLDAGEVESSELKAQNVQNYIYFYINLYQAFKNKQYFG